MKKLAVAIAMASGIGLVGAQQASAATFTFNFCGFAGASASCSDGHTGITTWSIAFTDIAGGDVNDYNAVVTLTSTNAGSIWMDAFDWTAGMDFTSTPMLTAVSATAPDPTTATTASYTVVTGDKVNNSGGTAGCDTGGSGNDVCTELTGAGTAPNINGTQTWSFFVNFVGAGLISDTSAVNLRAIFDDTAAAGGTKVSGIISPDGNYNTPTTTSTPTTTTTPTTSNVPEPAFLSLLGVSLAALVYRRRQA